MNDNNKRWLLSMMKTSGSKRRYVKNGSFSDERNTKKYQIYEYEDLPNRESFGATLKIDGKINFGLLIRFLNGQIGRNWDEVYSEFVSRIPAKLLYYKDIIFDFVADKIELKDGKLYNKVSGRMIWDPEQGEYNSRMEYRSFYVDPSTSLLMKTPDIPSRRQTKGMQKCELRIFREQQRAQKNIEKQSKN